MTSQFVQGVETVDSSHFITPQNIERLQQAKEANAVQVFSSLFFGGVDVKYGECMLGINLNFVKFCSSITCMVHITTTPVCKLLAIPLYWQGPKNFLGLLSTLSNLKTHLKWGDCPNV